MHQNPTRLISQLRSKMRLSALSSLQLFQLTRYAGFVLIGMTYARMGLPKVEIGRFEYFLLLMNLFSFFWIPGLMNSMLALYPTRSDIDKKKLLFNTYCLILALSLMAGVIQVCIPGGSPLGFGYLLLNNAGYLVEYILFLNGSRRKLILYGITMALIQFLLCVVPAYICGDTQYSLYALLAVAALKFIYVAWLLRRHTLIEFQYSRMTELFFISLPLMLSFCVNGSADYIDGFVVKRYFTLADFGVFRYGSREFPLFTVMAATLSMSLIPRIAGDLSEGLDSIRRESTRYMHMFFPIAIVCILAGQWLYIHFFSAQFAMSGRVFSALMLLTIPRLLFPQTILTGLKQNKLVLLAAVAEMIINIIASIALAHSYGLIGVAYGTVIAFVAEKLLMVAILYYRYHISPLRYVSPIPFAFYTALTVLSYCLSIAL